MDGFKPWTASVTLTAGQSSTQDGPLELNTLEEKVEVQGEATEVATQSVSAAATVSEQQLETLPLKTGKFTEALSVSPSVIRTQEGRLNFNGQAESQGMLLVDSAENVDPVSGSFGIPIPVDAIQSIKVFSTPDSPVYGGFSGGLTTIEIRPPVPNWNYKVLEFLPSFRAKNDSLVGIANFTPRIEVGGPLIKNKLNFSEDLGYEFRRDPVHGLTWPFNETYTHSFNSFTEFQYTISPKHLLNFNVNFFPSTNLYSNITALIPQSASVNFHRRGISVGFSDDYQFDSGMVLNTVVRYTNYYSNAEGQGNAEMTISPAGWGGNFFNAWWRNANQVEILPMLQLPSKSWLGTHELKFGVDLLYREFDSSSVSRPLNLLDQNNAARRDHQFSGPRIAECARRGAFGIRRGSLDDDQAPVRHFRRARHQPIQRRRACGLSPSRRGVFPGGWKDRVSRRSRDDPGPRSLCWPWISPTIRSACSTSCPDRWRAGPSRCRISIFPLPEPCPSGPTIWETAREPLPGIWRANIKSGKISPSAPHIMKRTRGIFSS